MGLCQKSFLRSTYIKENSCTEKGSLDGNSLNSSEHLQKSLSHKSGDSADNATIDDDHYEISPDSSSRCSDAKVEDASLDEHGYVVEGVLSPEVGYPRILSTIEEVTSVATTENSIRGTTSHSTIPEALNSPKYIKTVGEVESKDMHDVESSPHNNDQRSNSKGAKIEKS